MVVYEAQAFFFAFSFFTFSLSPLKGVAVCRQREREKVKVCLNILSHLFTLETELSVHTSVRASLKQGIIVTVK